MCGNYLASIRTTTTTTTTTTWNASREPPDPWPQKAKYIKQRTQLELENSAKCSDLSKCHRFLALPPRVDPDYMVPEEHLLSKAGQGHGEGVHFLHSATIYMPPPSCCFPGSHGLLRPKDIWEGGSRGSSPTQKADF